MNKLKKLRVLLREEETKGNIVSSSCVIRRSDTSSLISVDMNTDVKLKYLCQLRLAIESLGFNCNSLCMITNSFPINIWEPKGEINDRKY